VGGRWSAEPPPVDASRRSPADPIAPIYSGRPPTRQAPGPLPDGTAGASVTPGLPRAHVRDRCGMRAARHGPEAHL